MIKSKRAGKRNCKGIDKVTARKKLPYHAGQLVDDAIMASAEARRMLIDLLKKPSNQEEKFRLIGLILHEVTEIERSLKDIER